MFTKIKSIAFPLAVAASISGCASSIHIISPKPVQYAEPVPQAVLSFDNRFYPQYGWWVTLDGVTLDPASFSPAPAPNVTSTVPLPYTMQDTPPGNYLQQHNLVTHSNCGQFCVFNSESSLFAPPQLLFNASPIPQLGNYVVGSLGAASVHVQSAASKDIAVKVTEIPESNQLLNNPMLKLGATSNSLQNPGVPLTVTIPKGETSVVFWIEGQVVGYYALDFRGSGVSVGWGTGAICPQAPCYYNK
jgi:hypothetical protein